jgi:glycosyltransferase involved in cell wall biosynthesis
VDCILADSDAVSESVIDNHGVSKSKIQNVPIAGINTNVFSPRFDGSDSDKTLVATVGRLVEAKGYSELLEVAKTVNGKYEFDIVGDGPERERFESKAPDNVQFKGRVDNKEIPSVLSSCDLYFQPSHNEGLCMTVIEAMACELPVVASAVGGITESVVPEETGFLCQPKDVECFSERIRQLGNDPELRTRMGRRGRERVKENYSAEALADAFRDTLAAAEKR